MLKSQERDTVDRLDSKEKPFRIMVCDDSKLVRLTATKMLASKFDLVLAVDGEDAWDKLSSDPSIRMLFTDLGMPKLDGFGLIQRVRTCENENLKRLPIVVITGAAEDECVKQKIFDVGATDFITKPFKATDLFARANAHTNYINDKQELQKTTNVDVSTGALNLKGIMRRLDKDNAFAHRHSGRFSVALLSLDGFSDIYEDIGQKNSEAILKQIVKMLVGEVRKEDSVGRFSRSEFVLSLPMAKSNGALSLTKRICAKINALKIKLGVKDISLTASIGLVSTKSGTLLSVDDILSGCHSALNTAQALGGGHVKFQTIDDNEVKEVEALSIDTLLKYLSSGKKELVIDNMDGVVQKLVPLISFMNDEQRAELMQMSKVKSSSQ